MVIIDEIVVGEKCPFHLYLSAFFLYRIRSFYARMTFGTKSPAALAAVP